MTQCSIPEMRDPFSVVANGIRLISSSRQRFRDFVGRMVRNQLGVQAEPKAPAPYLGFGDSGVAQGRVLMTYLARPFHDRGASALRQNVANYPMPVEIAKAFVRLGYPVYIYD